MAKNDTPTNEDKKETKKSLPHLMSKKWHGVPIMIVGIISLVLLAGVVAVLYTSLSNNLAEEEQGPSLEQLAYESQKYIAEYDTARAINLWQEQVDSTDDSNEKATYYIQLSGVQVASGDYEAALETLHTIEGLESDINQYAFYSSLVSVTYELKLYDETERYIVKLISTLDESRLDYQLLLDDYNELLEEVRQ